MLALKLFGAATVLAAALATQATSDDKESPEPRIVALRLTPAPRVGEPWIATTEVPFKDLAKGKKSPHFKLTLDGIQPGDSQNAAIAVFANRISVQASDGLAEHPLYLVSKGYFFPASEKQHSFLFDATAAIAEVEKAGELALDRPLVFSILLVPGEKTRKFTEGIWTIKKASLSISQD